MLTNKDVQRWKEKIANGECCGADLPSPISRVISQVKYNCMFLDKNGKDYKDAIKMGLLTSKGNLTPVAEFFNKNPFKQYRDSVR